MAAKCPKCQSENTDTAQFCSNCASPLEPSKDIGVTKTIETPVEGLIRGALFADRYEIIEELGKGGMGKVYRALDTEVKEEVAVNAYSGQSGHRFRFNPATFRSEATLAFHYTSK